MAHKITVVVTEEQHKQFVQDLTENFRVTYHADGNGNRFWSLGNRYLCAGKYVEKYLAAQVPVHGSQQTAPVYEYHIYIYL